MHLLCEASSHTRAYEEADAPAYLLQVIHRV